MTPRLAETFRRDPGFQRIHNGISHGDQHIQCTYRVEVNGAKYRYLAVVGNTFGQHDDGYCEQIREAVAREIRGRHPPVRRPPRGGVRRARPRAAVISNAGLERLERRKVDGG